MFVSSVARKITLLVRLALSLPSCSVSRRRSVSILFSVPSDAADVTYEIFVWRDVDSHFISQVFGARFLLGCTLSFWIDNSELWIFFSRAEALCPLWRGLLLGMLLFPSLWRRLGSGDHWPLSNSPSDFNSVSSFVSSSLGPGSERPGKAFLLQQVFGSFSNNTRVLVLQWTSSVVSVLCLKER